ncbi:MAG TPA: hypothetical protein VGE41_13715 [Verrucomicrobiae bacterium]|jgi:hypothetical protein
MKICSHCGRENEDRADKCEACGQETFTTHMASGPVVDPNIATAQSDSKHRIFYEFMPLKPQDQNKDLVTLLKCYTLAEADSVVNCLEAAGIAVFEPDQVANLGNVGSVRVQISPKDYEAAREVLTQEFGDIEAAIPATPQTPLGS